MGIQEFGAAVRKRREELGYSVEDLARKAGVQRNAIYELERFDVKEIYISTFWAITRSLNWTAEDARRAYEGKESQLRSDIKDRAYEAVLMFLQALPEELKN